MIRGGEINKGTVLLIKNAPYLVVEREFVNPGKGTAFARCKMKNLKDGSVLTQTIKTPDMVEDATVETVTCQYQYTDADNYVFMDMESYDEVRLSKEVLGPALNYLTDNLEVSLDMYEGRVMGITLPNSVVLKIIDTQPNFKGDTASGGGKPATLETGIVVNVPFFVANGESIVVDTRSGEYIERVKK